MALVGVRELREQVSEIIRRVREEHAEYVVTYQGRPVAIILPLDPDRAEAEIVAASKKAVLGDWERYQRLADDIRCAWPAGASTQAVIDEVRR
ncbi:MAG TPA: type II toxin-antitoxin system Phd/YefM family antitoxin [Anaerolineae bacterium]|nr:type II toxin-antitoxin system Phd/YefM family antitoxin [Anaerolineae bacterium]HOR00226.1 type II toxin-antitoxin system Phd/YefM family antitoxin [Anaerolineae bacterium]HPL27489.1 type II toxin-antitoxin system Phd/YefM family antitoxin [Anaerolineae bacterium]